MLHTALDLAANLLLLVVVSILSGHIQQRWQKGSRAAILQGLLFGLTTVFGMMSPLVRQGGVILDGRTVPLSLCALFFGPLAISLAAILAGGYRIYLGGAGTLRGLLVILTASLLGLLARRLWNQRRRLPAWGVLLALGVTVHLVMLALIFTRANAAGLLALKYYRFPILFTYPLATLFIGEILVGQVSELRALEALRQVREIMAEFVRHSPIYVYIKEVSPTESRVLQASENFEEMVGIKGQTMAGKTMEELFSQDFAAKITADDWQVVSDGKILKLDEDYNGRSYTTIKFPIHVGGKNLLAGYTLDVSEQKRAERELAEKGLFLRTLVNAIPDLVWLKNAEGVYLACNPMFERFFGAKEAEIIGKTDYDFVSKEMADMFLMNDRLAMEANRPRRNEETITFADDGHEAFLETTKTPMFDERGRLIGVLGISRDLTERKRLEEERRQLESQLQQAQKMESMGSLAGGVAHDMNNVLGAIMALASANLGNHPPESQAHQAFETILRASERGGKMVRSLLGFARQSLAEERQLDLNAILRDEVSLLERTTLARVRLVMDLAPDLAPILGDANALTHAIMNLCVNAVDAMSENGTLTLRTRNQGREWVEVQVEDSGCGMSREILEKAMDPFFTTKAQGKGTGLGLALVYSTVKAHRGQMDIQSEVGRGTCVSLCFPACTPAEAQGAPRETPASNPPSGKLAVLLVDDDELIRSSFKALLGALGHALTAAACGEEALQKLEAGLQPDVVILDMNMPGLGGAGTLPRLRALRPNVPVLLSTGRADQNALDLVEAYPGVTLLSKPFGLAALRKQLDEVGQARDAFRPSGA